MNPISHASMRSLGGTSMASVASWTSWVSRADGASRASGTSRASGVSRASRASTAILLAPFAPPAFARSSKRRLLWSLLCTP